MIDILKIIGLLACSAVCFVVAFLPGDPPWQDKVYEELSRR